MKVVHDILDRPLGIDHPVVTMGTFDGLHRGHVAIIERLLDLARTQKRTSVAVTFDPHPQRVLAPEERAPRLLSTLDERLARFEFLGVEVVVVIPFSRAFSRWSAERYISELVIARLGAGHLVVGYDHAFGHDRRGKTDLLRTELERAGIPLEVVAPVKEGDGPIKSSRIRRLIAAGDLAAARALLGYEYHFAGEAVRGDGRGRGLGFPTANLQVPREKLMPPHGIYGATATVAQEPYHGLVHIGPRPTVGQDAVSVEIHLLDFPYRELYGERIRVAPEVALRKVEAFPDLDAMVARMEQDKQEYKQYIHRKEKSRAS
jgi:riboflavin kinase/FMN adenylyltransferase